MKHTFVLAQYAFKCDTVYNTQHINHITILLMKSLILPTEIASTIFQHKKISSLYLVYNRAKKSLEVE